MLQETKISTIGAVNTLISSSPEEAWKSGFRKCHEIISRLTLSTAQNYIDIPGHQRLQRLLDLKPTEYYPVIGKIQNASRLTATITLSGDPTDSTATHFDLKFHLSLHFLDKRKELAWLWFRIATRNGRVITKPQCKLGQTKKTRLPKKVATSSAL